MDKVKAQPVQFFFPALQAKGNSHSNRAASGSGGNHHAEGVGYNMEGPVCGEETFCPSCNHVHSYSY